MVLPELRGVPLGFTDAAPLPDGSWVFTAVAEDTDDAFHDGPCAGAAIGMADVRHRMQWLRPVEPLYKIEGIDVTAARGSARLLLVTDADDPATPAQLLGTTLR
jgi:hypothetical protein